MALFDSLHEQNMGQLAQVGVIAQQNFVTMQKLSDLNFLNGVPSLAEAVGARELGSKTNPAGPDSSVTGNK